MATTVGMTDRRPLMRAVSHLPAGSAVRRLAQTGPATVPTSEYLATAELLVHLVFSEMAQLETAPVRDRTRPAVGAEA